MDLLAPRRPEEDGKKERLELAVDAIRKKYGGRAISFGGAEDALELLPGEEE